MSFKQHYQLLASYNQRLNTQIYEAASKISRAELEKDLGAFFGSILGSLNHVMAGDLLWLSRFRNHSDRYQSLSKLAAYPVPSSLKQVLYDDLAKLTKARSEIDSIILDWLTETIDSDFEEYFEYKNTKAEVHQKNFGSVVAHLFNHQTHHRGQVSTLLSQLGVDIGVTDFIVDIPDKPA